MSHDKSHLPPLPEDVQQAIEVERQREDPPAERLEHVLARVRVTLGLPGGPGGPTGGDPPTGGTTLGSGLKVVAIVASLAVVSGGVVTYLLFRGPVRHGEVAKVRAEPKRLPATASDSHVPGTVSPPAWPSAPASLPAAASVPGTPVRARKRAVSRTSSASTLAAEREILDRARAALGRKQPAQALGSLAEHRRRFPDGHLAEERDALLILAMVGLDRRREARAAEREFRRRHPRSLLLPAVEAALGQQR